MSNLQLRRAAREIFDQALAAVDAGDAVRRSVIVDGSTLRIAATEIDLAADKPVYAIAIGKAAYPMAATLDKLLEARIIAGVIAGSPAGSGGDRATVSSNWMTFNAGHPEPNEESLAAALASFELLERANEERALVVFLVSGGGSALIEWPINEHIKLADLRAANQALVKSGASIAEINAVRCTFSAVKGGRLAARASHCDQITLIVSDVPANEERSVASGPTLAPASGTPRAQDVINRYHLRSQLPEAILFAVDANSNSLNSFAADSNSLRGHFVILDNHHAVNAAAEAARAKGIVTEVANDITNQPIEEGCAQLMTQLDDFRRRPEAQGSTVCLISGGEFACPVKGDGIGGRNLETALRLAMSPGLSNAKPFVALCAGTDGIDGNSPAAGAIVDQTTIERARTIGLDAQDSLNRSDAYSFFVALGDVIATGPTGTNVRDLRILLRAT